MTTHELSILGPKGDIKITWDHDNPADREKARQEVAKLKSLGYLFFAVDGSPADEVTAGAGELHARIITAEEVVEEPRIGPTIPATYCADKDAVLGSGAVKTDTGPEQPNRGGRKKGVPNTVKTIAVPPLRGG